MPDRSSADTSTDKTLAEAQDRFIALWGQMGSNWGIARTMAQVHALLYIIGRPLSTDDVMTRLAISRGNASMTLRSLVDWGVVTRMHERGDRKEYFVAEQDVWKMFRTIVSERKKREIDPLLESLHECRQMTERSHARKVDAQAAQIEAHNTRLDNLLDFTRTVDKISRRFVSPLGEGLRKAAQLLGKVS